ncbi:CHAP domain-containing protein [Nonomuraea sp. M3C6]|uniref:CHAP domain-containing protein n=1 Tax=Nonomuraea marmarensis TaxID=3351344 RepID=A0ABW7A4E4_9ACTN
MTPETQKFIDLLESQVGYAAKGGYTKFGEWYGNNVEFDADYTSAPWCDMYLSWAAHKLGYEKWIGQFAWTVAHAEWFQKQDAWGHKPEPGAFVFYDWSGTKNVDNIDHVGIVTKVEGDTIFTIEGNIDGGLIKRKERDTSKVVGYGYPERIKSRLEEATRQVDGQTVHEPPQATSSPTTTTAAAGKMGPKMAKHAKPTTADTKAATAEPLPTHIDASATGPLPSINTPTMIGSAVVAALAVLAVAKTRRRSRPTAASTPPRPARKPKRRRRRTTEDEQTLLWMRHLLDGVAADAAQTATPPADAGLATAPLAVEAAPRHALGRITPTHHIADTGPFEVVIDTGPLEPFVDTGPFEHIVIPEATSPFDAFTPARRTVGDILDDPGPHYRGRRRRHDIEPATYSTGMTSHDRHGVEPPLRQADDRELVGAGGRGRHRA